MNLIICSWQRCLNNTLSGQRAKLIVPTHMCLFAVLKVDILHNLRVSPDQVIKFQVDQSFTIHNASCFIYQPLDYENVSFQRQGNNMPNWRENLRPAPPLPPLSQQRINELPNDSSSESLAPPLPPRWPILSPQSFAEAEKRAQVIFLHQKVLDCDTSGLVYFIKDHDITLRIPVGAVPSGKKIHFEIGVAMFGPFKFPEGTQPISPVLWLCLLEDCKFNKPFQVILPHFLTGLTKEGVDKHQVVLMKANHSDRLEEDSQMKYIFQTSDVTPNFTTHRGRSFGIISMDHCCFYCLQANQTSELAMDAGYCLTRIEAFISQQRSEVHFAAVYCLQTCLRVSQLAVECNGCVTVSLV